MQIQQYATADISNYQKEKSLGIHSTGVYTSQRVMQCGYCQYKASY